MAEYKLSEEAAQEQLDSLLDYYEIELEDLPEAQRQAVKASVRKLVKAIRIGRLEIDFDGNGAVVVRQNIRAGEPLTYREIDGKAKVAMGNKEANDSYGRAYALMGSLCGLGETAISQLKGPDLSLVETLGVVFLQA